MSNLNLYSLFTILFLILTALTSLSIWYWLGRRQMKRLDRRIT